MSDKPKITVSGDGVLGFDWPQRTPEEKAARKSFSAQCGHVKRRILSGERLKGKTLKFALDVISDDTVCAKLKAGEKLTDYEAHLVVDVWLLHLRLG